MTVVYYLTSLPLLSFSLFRSQLDCRERSFSTTSLTAGTTSWPKVMTCRSWSSEGQKMNVSIPFSSAKRESCSVHFETGPSNKPRSEEHTSELQSRQYLVCRLLLEKKKKIKTDKIHIELNIYKLV